MTPRISVSHLTPLVALTLLLAGSLFSRGQESSPQDHNPDSSGLLRPGSDSVPVYPFPPYLEADRSCPLEPAHTQDFEPIRGGLPWRRTDQPDRTCGIVVNLARGDASYLPEPDFLLRSPTGADAVFQRCFRTDRARTGYGSPGLSPGWVHNYDVIIENSHPAHGDVTWQPLKLVYPNGEHDLLRPELTADGEPTGRLLTTDRMPFTAKGKPDDAPGRWRSITLTWRDRTTWVFAPYSSNSYFLDRLDTLTLDWDDDRRLLSVADVSTHDKMLLLHYDTHGLLSTITDRQDHVRRYRFDVPAKTSRRSPRLIAVSEPTVPGVVRARTRWEFDYSSVSTGPMLWRVRQIEGPGGADTKCYIGYHEDRVSAVTDMDSIDHTFTYKVGSTRVTLQDQDRRVLDFWTQRLDNRGRNTGVTDSQGVTTVINYN